MHDDNGVAPWGWLETALRAVLAHSVMAIAAIGRLLVGLVTAAFEAARR